MIDAIKNLALAAQASGENIADQLRELADSLDGGTVLDEKPKTRTKAKTAKAKAKPKNPNAVWSGNKWNPSTADKVYEPTPNIPIAERARPKAEYKELRCSKCAKDISMPLNLYTIYSKLVTYTCDKCMVK